MCELLRKRISERIGHLFLEPLPSCIAHRSSKPSAKVRPAFFFNLRASRSVRRLSPE